MRTFLFQCSTLMMVILVYSSPCNRTNKEVCKNLLREIKQEALNLTRNFEMFKKEWVPKISSDQTCVPHFFCLAEKVVQNITNKPVEDKLSRLQEHLVQYNNLTQETDCEVTPFGSYPLTWFLDNMEKCVMFTLLKKTSP